MPDTGRAEPAPLAAVHRLEQAVEHAIESTERSLARRFGAGCLHTLRLTFKFLFVAALVLYFAAGTLFLLARHVWLPRIDEQRPQLEQLLSRQLRTPVHIGRIAASWHGFRPSLKLTDVRVVDQAGAPRFGLGQIEGTLSWLSVPALEPRFTALHLLAPDIEVRRFADGRIAVAGYVLDPAAKDTGDRNALDWLLDQGRVVVRDASLRFVDEAAGRDDTFTDVSIDLRRSLTAHQFALQARPPASLAAPLDLRMDFRTAQFTRASRVADWSGRLYAAVDYADLAQLATVVPLLPKQMALAQAQGALRVWLDFDELRAERVVADVALADVDLRLAPELEPLRLTNARGRLTLRDSGSPERGEREIALAGVTLRLPNAEAMPPLDARLRLVRRAASTDARGELDANRLVLQDVTALAGRLPLPAALRTTPAATCVRACRPSRTSAAASRRRTPAGRCGWPRATPRWSSPGCSRRRAWASRASPASCTGASRRLAARRARCVSSR